MPEAEFLFAYGTLGLAGPEPERGVGVADAVRGRLFDLGPYPILIDWDDPAAGRAARTFRPTRLVGRDGGGVMFVAGPQQPSAGDESGFTATPILGQNTRGDGSPVGKDPASER